jgi:hypothetical protein
MSITPGIAPICEISTAPKWRFIIELCGQVEVGEINALSPLAIRVERAEPAATVLAACTDQSGLIGLLRHLHGLGFIFLSVSRLDIAGVRKNGPGN